ncbi:RusA family crossover junction endodeoxyribonuclease [Caulobacter sp. FWC2]|uniref:RusA family crossover junction endodeoxyribonuclease n=1 Tax=Caulobacter sp. FWC2 TaxID=69664 RepID=UPI000C147899|nr:RusA family crossover junction endodeoxyribonuclease [Caulobacter sp. FWC2]PIB91274.1 hypothetical protein CSW62_06610 [Caulobacter sp. FWC2]
MITFSLPFPPGVNNLYPQVKTKTGFRRITSKEYAVWQKAAGLMVPRQAKGAAPQWFRVALSFDRPDKGNRVDLDGRIKVVLDLLKKTGVIADDRWNDGMTVAWSSPCTAPVYPTQPMVQVTIEPLEAA